MLLKKPIASVILVLAVLIFGSIALERLSIELMPDIARPTLLVRTDYSGAPASEVEFRITEQLESVLSGVRGVQEIESLSRQSQSLIFLTFEWGFDMDIKYWHLTSFPTPRLKCLAGPPGPSEQQRDLASWLTE